MKKLFHWLVESRRPLHVTAGTSIATLTLLLCALTNCSNTAIAANTLWTSLVASLSAEFKDYDHNDKFDWLDVLATMIPSIIISLVILL